MRGALNGLARRLRGLEPALARALEEAVGDAARLAAEDARVWAPVDSGELRRGIVARNQGLVGTVISTAPHGAMVELGTSRMAARPYLQPAALAAHSPFLASAKEIAVRIAGEVWK